MQARDKGSDDPAFHQTPGLSKAMIQSRWSSIGLSPLRKFPSMRTMSPLLSDSPVQVLSQRIQLPPPETNETAVKEKDSRLLTEARKFSPKALTFDDVDSPLVPLDITTQCSAKEKSKQERLVSLNNQLTKMNAIANLINFIKNKHMEKSLCRGRRELEKLKDRLKHQTSTIKQLNKSIQHLTVQVKCQSELSQRLDKSLQSQRELLELSTQQSLQDTMKHQSLLSKQQMILDKLLTERMKHDLLVDSIVLFYSVYLTRTTLVSFPLHTVLKLIKNPKLRKWFDQLSRFLIVLYLFKVLKSWTVNCGLYYSVGSFVRYCDQLVQYFHHRYCTVQG